MTIPKFLQPILASYRLNALDKDKDREIVITEVLNKGDGKALKWLGKIYSQEEIKKTIASPRRGMWARSVLLYWLKIFDIDYLSNEKVERALINLNSL